MNYTILSFKLKIFKVEIRGQLITSITVTNVSHYLYFLKTNE
jgi:hypothetical protein